MNALRSGIDAKSQIIFGETQDDLDGLKWDYDKRYFPSNPAQRMLVDIWTRAVSRRAITTARSDIASTKCPKFNAEIKPNGLVAFLAPPPIFVSGDEDQSGVLMNFPFPSCQEWRNHAVDVPEDK